MVPIGLVVVLAALFGGFTIAGGKIPSLFHVSEIVTIMGIAAGTVLISTPAPVMKMLGAKIKMLMGKNPYDKAYYLEALKMLYEFFQVARKDGLVAVEQHIEGPFKSPLFTKYPKVLANHHAIDFFCDSMRLVVAGSVPPHDLESMLEEEIDIHHHAEARPTAILTRLADGLPGIGIVAAVLGVVVTMAKISGPVEQIGESVAAALTGTLLGILLAYGFLGPMANGIDAGNDAESKVFSFLKASVVASAKGFPPIVAVEFARRAIYSENRPSFQEMEAACTGKARE